MRSAIGFFRIFRCHGGTKRQAQAHRFNGRTHRVGREHPPTTASPRAGVLFNGGELGFVDLAAAQLTNRFKSADHGEVATTQFARLDGAAIDKDTGDVHPGHRQHGGGHVFVAAANGQDAIHALTVAGGLDRIGNHFSAHQGVLHPFGAHGDAITHGDGSKHLRHAARCLSGLFSTQRQLVQADIAGRDGAVTVGNPDDRFAEVTISEANSAQHGAVGAALNTLRDGAGSEGGHGSVRFARSSQLSCCSREPCSPAGGAHPQSPG